MHVPIYPYLYLYILAMCNYLQYLYIHIVRYLQLSTDAIEYVVFLQVPATEEMVIGTSSHITTGGYRQKCYSDGLVGNDTIHVCTDYI